MNKSSSHFYDYTSGFCVIFYFGCFGDFVDHVKLLTCFIYLVWKTAAISDTKLVKGID